jgi:enoyl-CoA hydratase/carnithine racemase
MTAIERLPKPVVAAVRGWCLGGGFDLAMACHIRLAASDAQFGHPGGALGILTGWGGTQRLPALVGAARAREALATGRTISSDEALAWRLVSRVAPAEALVADALALAVRAANR